MKNCAITLGTLAALALSVGSAKAADLPARDVYRAPVVAPAFNWTGFYLGVVGGYAFGSNDITSNFNGGFVGGTIGYNWQPVGSNFVFGVEADGGWTNFGDSGSATAAGITVTASSEAQALATLRARLGAAFDRTLVYVTGGGAWARNEITVSVAAPALGIAGSASDTQNHFGYVIGAGVEQAFGQWTGKIEYNYIGLGSENYFSSIVAGGLASGDADVHLIKGGLNYRF
jgi:outer membrane immunogenic protein